MNRYTGILIAVIAAIWSSDLRGTEPTEFLQTVDSEITVAGETFQIREMQGGGNADSVWRFEDTVWKGDRTLVTISGWRTARPLTTEWEVCLEAVSHPAPCLHLTQTYPDIRGESVTLASSSVEPSTYGVLEITYGTEILYSGPFNAHFGELDTIRSLHLEIPDDLAAVIISGASGAREIHGVLAAASSAADETTRKQIYDPIPLLTAADPVGAALLVMEGALPDLVSQRAVSPSTVLVERAEPVYSQPPNGYLERSNENVAEDAVR